MPLRGFSSTRRRSKTSRLLLVVLSTSSIAGEAKLSVLTSSLARGLARPLYGSALANAITQRKRAHFRGKLFPHILVTRPPDRTRCPGRVAPTAWDMLPAGPVLAAHAAQRSKRPNRAYSARRLTA